MPSRAGKPPVSSDSSDDDSDSDTAHVEVADDETDTATGVEEEEGDGGARDDEQEESDSSSEAQSEPPPSPTPSLTKRKKINFLEKKIPTVNYFATSEFIYDEEQTSVIWTGYGKKIPVLVFRAEAIIHKKQELRAVGEKYHLAFKIVKTECKLVRNIMTAHGFHEAHPNSTEFNLLWTGMHVQPYLLRSLLEHQKVNHFPRSYEITRKDRLFKNVQRMQQTKGFKHFDFIPSSYIVPGEYQDFCSAFIKDKGPWIVKPIASSRGRGIFLINHPEQVPMDETMIVCKYLANPLLIDGFKFDLRLYVAVTSYDPLVIYMYEEGMTRFATVKYEKNLKNIRNTCMHLTNYSVNKKSNDYVKNDDPDVEDFGNKWTLGALLRYLRSEGRDTTAMMMRVEDVIIKTLLSAENTVATACKMFMPFKGNCFEVYGFDILIDDNLRPWVLEVNLSPSLACDSPLDLKLKSNMLSDLFTLIGVVCHDPMVRKTPNKRSTEIINKVTARAQGKRPQSASSVKKSSSNTSNGPTINPSGLTGEEIRMTRRAKEEHQRRGGWIRIFPSPDSWELYSPYMQYPSNNNLIIWQQLFPERARHTSTKPSTASYSSGVARTKSVHLHSAAYPQLHISQQDDAVSQALARSLQYERKLSSLGHRQRRKPTQRQRAILGAPCLNGNLTNGSTKSTLAQGIEEGSSQSSSSTSVTTLPANTRPATKDEAKQATEKQAARQEPRPPSPMKEPDKPPLLTEPKYNVVELLEKGKTMSKVQARFAFASYLSRVQERLMVETGSSGGHGETTAHNAASDDYMQANEQMDLVLRFLKRAAGNLQQPFKVVVPSRKLPINDRRRILAKQLGDFVHIYNKETEQLRQRNKLDEKHLRRPPSFSQNDGLDENMFNKFVALANEGELEEVLTTYTKLNKSASIFLGSNSKSTYEQRSGTPSTASPASTPSELNRRKGSADSMYRQAQEEGSMGRRSRLHSASSTTSSYAGAVAAYSTRLAATAPSSAGSSGGRRPQSAAAASSSSSRPGSGTSSRPGSGMQQSVVSGSVRSRPMSAASSQASRSTAALHRERPDGAESVAAASEGVGFDDEAMNVALQRIVARQQQRQYAAAGKGATQLLEGGGGEEALTAAKPPSVPRTAPMARGGANETFNSFVHEAGQQKGEFKPNFTSTSFHIQQHQQMVKQQRMLEQSKQLLELSKAKHQAMVAQAHAAVHSTHTPHPPGGVPPAETRNKHRHSTSRPPAMSDKPTVSVSAPHTNPTQSSSFYNSLKYDSSTDFTSSAKPVYSSGYNTGY